MQVSSIGAREEALARLRAAMASAAPHRRHVTAASGDSMSGIDVADCRYRREELNVALARVTAAPRPLAPDIAEPVHQALRLLDELRWVDDAIA